jgi:two-component system phosphate regulon sensor histidine kinase PhoR
MVEAYRRYIDLELRATPPEKFQTKPLNEPALAIEPAAAPEAEADLEPQLTPDLKPNLVLPAAKPIIYKPNLPAVSQVKLAEAAPAAPTIPLPSRVAGQSTIDLRSQPAQLVKKSVDYLSILDTVEEGVVVSNALGRVQLVNRAAEHILGRSRRELLEQSIGTIYGQIASEEKIEILMTSFSRRNEPLPTFVERDDRAIQGRLIPWRDDEQEWLGIVAVFKDVTPSVKAERIQNNFIMALSRVLRGPLTLIKGYAELTTTGLFEEYSPEQLQVQRIIHSSVERVVEILDNAIQISTQQRNKLLPKFENVNLIKVIDEVWREITPLAKLRQIKLVREISTAPLSVTADWLQLYRILENLLSNACRFTPPGGQVTLRAWVQHEREGNISQPRLILTVADNGVGIPRTEFKRIFDPFYQLDNQPPTDERGMGLGLAVVKELVEMHRGKVWVESKVGEGSIFQVSLPLTQS